MLKEAIREENEKKRLEGTYKSHESRKNGSLQLDGSKTNVDTSRSTWTDNQIAKKAGVGVGSVARYNKVMNSNDEDLQDEDSKLRALISNNFGRRKNSPEKDRKALETYVTLRGYKNGGDRQAQCQSGTMLTLEQIAKELNMSKRNLQRALSIERNLTDSMKELLDDGTNSSDADNI